MPSPSSLELKISPFQKAFSLFAVVVSLGGLVIFIWAIWRSPVGFNATSITLSVVVLAGIIHGTRRVWNETGRYLRVDDRGIVFGERQAWKTFGWNEIYGFTTDIKSTSGARGHWLSLRGRDNEVLAQWNREWFRFTRSQLQRSDDIEQWIREKLRASGRLHDENTAMPKWQSSHPLSEDITLQVQTMYGWAGCLFLTLFLPCAYFCWVTPKIGPIVSSIFLVFAVVSLAMMGATSTLSLNEEYFEESSLYGRSRVTWSEITRVQMSEDGAWLHLKKNNKRQAFSGPKYWKPQGKQDMLLYLEAICEKRGIPFDTRANPRTTFFG